MTRPLRPSNTRQTILVVDENKEALLVIRELLERERHLVLTASNGEQAMELLKHHDVHLVLADAASNTAGEWLVPAIRSVDPFVQIILRARPSTETAPAAPHTDLDILAYYDKSEGPEKLLMWVDVGLKAERMVRTLRERERLYCELVSNVSHEFRTPLNIIDGYTGLMLDGAFGALPEGAATTLRSMSDATRHLTELVSDFLNYSKIEARAIEVSHQPIATSELVRELEQLGSLLLEGRDVAFSVELHDVPPALVTDGVKLRTILRNLITNAIKYTARGKIVVRIARHETALRFAVQDTGPGIPREDLAVIFEAFRQLNAPEQRMRGGVGLGLALSRRLARILDGDLEVESEPGVGSTFTLVLPMTQAAGQAVGAAAGGMPSR